MPRKAERRQPTPGTLGLLVLAMLIALTVAEYFIALALERNLPIMIAMNMADASLIMLFFMHLTRLWRKGE